MDPLDLAEMGSILDNVLVRREKDLELANAKITLQSSTLRRVTLVSNHLDRWCPLCKFSRPIGHRRKGHNNEIRPVYPLDFDKEGYKRNSLDGFTETL